MFQPRRHCLLPALFDGDCVYAHAARARVARGVAGRQRNRARMVAVIASYGQSLAFDRFTLTRSIFLGAAHRAKPASETPPARPARPAAPTGPA